MAIKRGKAQVTLFIIIAVAIVVVALVFFLFINKGNIFSKTEAKQVTDTRMFVNSIVENSSYDILYLIGEQGGYVDLPTQSLLTLKEGIAYSLYDGQNRLPSMEFIQNETSDYIAKTFIFYYNDHKSKSSNPRLNSTDFDINNVKIKTEIESDNVIITTYLPTKINDNGQVFDIQEYSTKLPLKFGYVYSIAKDMTEKKLKNQRIDEFYFANKDISVDIIPVDSTKIIYSLKSFDTINNKFFIFNVAMLEK